LESNPFRANPRRASHAFAMRASTLRGALLALLALLSLASLASADAAARGALEVADLDDAELDALLDEAEAAAGARGLKAADLDDALDLLPDEPELEDDEAPARDATGAAVEAVPDPEPDDDEPDAIEPEPEPARRELAETAQSGSTQSPSSSTQQQQPPSSSSSASGPPSGDTVTTSSGFVKKAPNVPDPTFVKPERAKRTKTARPGQEPGACTYCRAAAHRLQTAMQRGFRDAGYGDDQMLAAARATRERLPAGVYAETVGAACADEAYWRSAYAAFEADVGGAVLAGNGLDWSTADLDVDAGGDHVGALVAACEAMEADEEALYEAFWKGKQALGGRKWFFQAAFCGEVGGPCNKAKLDL
jgi:hypothetical protein